MFADIVLPVSVPKPFTYGIPVEFQDQVKIGMRVQVEFGKRKRYSGIVANIHNQMPSAYVPKPILSVLDERPIVTENQLSLWSWLSNYYMANIGDVMSVAMPSALKLSSEATVQLLMENDEFDINELNDDEYLIFEALSTKKELKIEEIQLILGKKNVFPILNGLIELRIVALKETLKERYKPKLKPFVRLSTQYQTEDTQKQLINDLERAAKQQNVILMLLTKFSTTEWIDKKVLEKTTGASGAIIKALIDKGILELEHRQVSRLVDNAEGDLTSKLSPEQEIALKKVKDGFANNKPALLYGVTGSGKTHLYIKLIEEQIAQGKQCLYLLPEIALTSQIIKRLKKHFGSDVGVYHSKFSDAERVEIWNKTLNNEYKVIVGARSAIFLPFQSLGFIVVDEEHETSFKQYDPSPRYQARDTALWLSVKYKANILLGSATPSYESYFNALHGKYQLVELNSRFGAVEMPDIEIVNMRKQNIPGKTYNRFSKRLIEELRATLANGQQAILFRNRRGYSSFVQCTMCEHTIKCQNCDVSLTYHKFRDQLECHYCGFKQKVPFRCPSCDHNELEKIGLGTEKIEEELSVFLPEAKIARMDLDTTRNKNAHEKIIHQFEQKQIDILVGTQMVTKGLHFNDVRLVGILNADSLLKFPDFRASERAFQLMEQVSGRAGRIEKGKVIVQVRDTNDIVLKHLLNHDFTALFNDTISERRQWYYPPYYRQIKLTLKHKDWKTNYQAATQLAKLIRDLSSQGVKGPSEPTVSKVNLYYIQEVLITVVKQKEIIRHTKQAIRQAIDQIKAQKGNSQLRINIDVDPS